jgi:hypothetical protein
MSTYTFPNSGGLKLNKDHITPTTAADCAPGAVGEFTTTVALPPVAQYTTETYSVWACQTGGTGTDGVEIDGYPISRFAFKLFFVNNSGATIPGNTAIEISFATLGI